MDKAKDVMVLVRLPRELRKRLDHVAVELGLSRTELVRRLLDLALKTEDTATLSD